MSVCVSNQLWHNLGDKGFEVWTKCATEIIIHNHSDREGIFSFWKVLPNLSCALFAFKRHRGHSLGGKRMEERKGDNSLAGNSLQKSLIKNSLIKKVQGPSQLETAASQGLHLKDLCTEPSPGSSLGLNSVTPWSASILLRVKLLYFVSQWFYLQWQGATQTASVYTLGEHNSKSVPKENSNHLGFYSIGIGRVGAA